LSAVLAYLGQTGEAEKELKEALHIRPTYTAYYNLAYFYYAQGQFREAAQWTEKALTLNSDDYRVWQMLGASYEWIGQSRKAKDAYSHELEALQKAEPLKKDDAKAQAELGLLYSKMQQRSNALSHLQTALAIAPNDPSVLSTAGEAYENFGERQLAIAYMENAIRNGWDRERFKRNPDLQTFLGDPEVKKRLAAVKGPENK
jgi:serine/threonine-protein kinase